MTQKILLAAFLILALGAGSARAADDASSESASAPTMVAKADNATQGLGDNAPMQPDTGVTDNSSAGAPTDTLASFGPSSGTVVGNRALELRDEVLRLRASVNLNSNEFAILRSSGAAGAVQYHSTVAAVTARLQNGTTRGNPILLRQWDEASASLDEVNSSLSRLNSLQTAIDADASMASYLMESVQAAFELSGAVDEDHDQLKLLRDEISRMIVQLDYLRNQTTNDLQRQTNYLTTERANLQALAFAISRGELLGNSLANRPVVVNAAPVVSLPPQQPPPSFNYGPRSDAAPAVPQAAPMAAVTPGQPGPAPMSPREVMQENGSMQEASTGAATTNPNVGVAPSLGQLLVLIRFNQPDVRYVEQLTQAVGSAMQRRPDAEFSVVAVSPNSGDPAELARLKDNAQRNADDVKRSLIQMGLAPSRITQANTSTDSAQTAEVHVYIR